MKALLVLPLAALVACANKPMTSSSPEALRLATEYRHCAFEAAAGLRQARDEMARAVALTAIGVCRPTLLQLAKVVEEDNKPDPMRQVFAHEYANNVRDKVLSDIAADIMKRRAS